VLIATPGRILDLINQKHVNLAFVETFILDEADRMLDMGFIHDMKKIANFLPKKRQTLFFSATFAPKVMDLAQQFLTNPVKIEIAPQSSTIDTVKQHLYTLNKENKLKLLIHILS
jgi:ATP-dependent RNA helicase RhlE